MHVWFNGKMGDGPITIDAGDRGLTLGDGLFETILVVDGVALWCTEHLVRFKASAHELGIAYPEAAIVQAVSDLTHGLHGTYVLRLTLTRGAGGRGLAADVATPTFFATLAPFDAKLMLQPVRCCVVGVRRNEASPTARMKALSYVDQVLAAREAAAQGFEDGIMCNNAGHVACGTIGNLFMLRGKTLVTPGLDQGILPGIMRALVIKSAGACGYALEERAIGLHELDSADGLFLTNSLRLLRPSLAHVEKDFAPLVSYICSQIEGQCGRDPREN